MGVAFLIPCRVRERVEPVSSLDSMFVEMVPAPIHGFVLIYFILIYLDQGPLIAVIIV